jgi:hypothetical protein
MSNNKYISANLETQFLIDYCYLLYKFLDESSIDNANIKLNET